MGVQPGAAPVQVSLINNPIEELDVEPRFVAEDSNVT